MLSLELQLSADELLRALLRLDASHRVQILDSGGARALAEARFLIAGFDPLEIIEARGDSLHFFRRDTGRTSVHTESFDVLGVLDERLAGYYVPHETASSSPACGACIATFSYEFVHRIERLRRSTHHSPSTSINAEPDATLAFYDTLVIHDYARSVTEVVSVASARRLNQFSEIIEEAATLYKAQQERREQMEERGEQIDERHEQIDVPPLSSQSKASANQDTQSQGAASPVFSSQATSNFTREQYLSAVERIKEHIAAGDIYQANLTQQFAVALAPHLSPERIFLNLRRDHPAAFGAFLRRRNDVVVSASPERFLHVDIGENGERLIEAWPIKGTRPRGSDAAEDARLRDELKQSEKDRAENVMIVDLLRNDLGRVCRYGSVSVADLFTIQ